MLVAENNKSQKRLLFITPFSLCSNHAGVVYTRQLLAELSKHCEIDLISFRYKNNKKYHPGDNIKVLEEIEIGTMSKLFSIFSLFWVFPLFSVRFSWRRCKWMQSLINSNVYDFVYFDFSQTFAYSLFLKHPHKILMAHDVMAQKYSRMKTYLRPWAMLSERKILKQGDVFTFSEKDCKLIKDLYGYPSRSTTFFLSKEVIAATPTGKGDYFVFFGGWSREENYEALDWFLNNVNRLIPDVKYKIIGGGLPDNIKKEIALLPNFEYLGFVDNPYPVIAGAKAEIAPLRKGAGVKVKCIDALGCGTPVIGTDVAFEGIPDEFSELMLKAETAQDYADIISGLNWAIDKRKRFKSFFIERYNDKKILNYINGNK